MKGPKTTPPPPSAARDGGRGEKELKKIETKKSNTQHNNNKRFLGGDKGLGCKVSLFYPGMNCHRLPENCLRTTMANALVPKRQVLFTSKQSKDGGSRADGSKEISPNRVIKGSDF